MKKIVTNRNNNYFTIWTFIANANEVNVFSARHYDSDIQLYEKFTAKTGIKVNIRIWKR